MRLLFDSDYASARVERYWDALSNPLQSSEYQTSLSVWAIIRGEWFGVGLGNSRAKLTGFLPVSWSDNIFAIVGEELGLLGAFLVILLFAMFAYRGLKIAINAPDNFGMLLATGITSLLILQAILNTAVVAAVAPATGVTLPFISYGGSSLVTAMGAVGILLSISRYSSRPVTDYGSTGNLAYARFNFGWRDGGARLPRARSRSQARRSQRPAVRRSSAASGRKSSSAPKRRTVRESR